MNMSKQPSSNNSEDTDIFSNEELSVSADIELQKQTLRLSACFSKKGLIILLVFVISIVLLSTLAKNDLKFETEGGGSFLLKECKGDCDSDTDCSYGLVCYVRDPDNLSKEVPGCTGNANKVRGGSHDFCIEPPDSNTLVVVGQNVLPDSLKECQGDCNSDEECKNGLKCRQRDTFEDVPGCTGTGDLGWDYCYDPTGFDPPLEQKKDSVPGGSFALGECQGDCERDNDCNVGFVCFRREAAEKDVLGCYGDANKVGHGGVGFCTKPQDSSMLVIMSIETTLTNSSLDECHGHCVEDYHCKAGLHCLNRNSSFVYQGNQTIPGCIHGVKGFNYCYNKEEFGIPLGVVLGGEATELFGLGECIGDCDKDSDCEYGLVCLQREKGSADVLGCYGDADQIEDGYVDFCVKPEIPNTLVIMGGGETIFSNSLNECQGDCDTDDDCANGLRCFQRGGGSVYPGDQAIPGCIGGEPEYDYCFNYTEYGLPLIKGQPSATYFSYAECQGDCDDDSDCDFGLICFQREMGTSDVPGCFGDADLIDDSSRDFCIRPLNLSTLVITGDSDTVTANSLGECQGDCDTDDDCMNSLKCQNRNGFEDVPGCDGPGGKGWDYCYNYTAYDPPLVDKGNSPALFELEDCQGDCDHDHDCAFGLVCSQRESGESVSGECYGDASKVGDGGVDFCIQPAGPSRLVIKGRNVSTLLGECQGDCNEDSDCEAGLNCRKRKDYEDVPGCNGEGGKGVDYCYNSTGFDTPLTNESDGKSDFTLGECQGDCDEDTDCEYDLVCFQRDDGTSHVPGCFGDADKVGDDGNSDFCIQPPKATTLVIVGLDVSTNSLGECQGHCESDSHCREGLKCKVRTADEDVAGCDGTGAKARNYCYSETLNIFN